MRVLVITPPMVQLNAPYAAGPQLAGSLKTLRVSVVQEDVSLALALRIFSGAGLRRIAAQLRKGPAPQRSSSVRGFLRQAARYVRTVDGVIRFLQGAAPGLAARIVTRAWLPEGPRFRVIDDVGRALGEAEGDPLDVSFEPDDLAGRARYLASLYIDDLADVVRDGIDRRFELSRYGERLAVRAPAFAPIRRALESDRPSLIDRMLDRLGAGLIRKHRPDLVAITVPFPGNVYGAFRLARAMKRSRRGVRIAIGGGYVSTELRELTEAAVFDYVDYVVLDAGEEPLRLILKDAARPRTLCRTWVREDGRVRWYGDAGTAWRHRDLGTPSVRGLPLRRYLSMVEVPNPMHRLWSEGRWNKLVLAHGCYWRRCAFCDVSLDYIRRFDTTPASQLVDRMQTMIRETGHSAFHFVDEAAPPRLLAAVADEIVRRKLGVTWWTNIRFEKGFDAALARRLAASGCLAVSGGLEGVTDRLLRRMNKGITSGEAARAMKALADAGILVHAYLIYGFPGQGPRDVIDGLEMVRQLFTAGYLHSAYWHRFALTVHSPMYRNPRQYGIRRVWIPAGGFAKNEAYFEEAHPADHERLGEGLRKGVYNYVHGAGLARDVREWFPMRLSAPRIGRGWLRRAVRR